MASVGHTLFCFDETVINSDGLYETALLNKLVWSWLVHSIASSFVSGVSSLFSCNLHFVLPPVTRPSGSLLSHQLQHISQRSVISLSAAACLPL